jgi:ribosome biogenesis GTPase
MIGENSMFAGNSGVGKSTLQMPLNPILIWTKEMWTNILYGQHTTTFAEMYDLFWRKNNR